MAELGGPLLESVRVPENDGAHQGSLVSKVDAAKATATSDALAGMARNWN